MSSIMTGNSAYPQMNFDPWQINNAAYHAAFTAGVYGSQYDFTKSPTTSGGSDESMNDSRVDPKRSPKYLEKRMKNNEAAKKSRLQRKKREQEHVHENSMLKQRNAYLEKQNEELLVQMQQLQKTVRDMTTEREMTKRRLESYEAQQNMMNPLRDMTNTSSNHLYGNTNYENL